MTTNDKPKEKLLTWQYICVTLIHFMVNTSFYLVTPILTAYVVTLGATLALAGVVSGIFSITALVTRPVSGLAANHMAKKRLQCLASIIMGISCMCYALVPLPNLMVFFRILQGIGFALYGTSAIVTVSTMIPETRMKEGISYFGLSQVLASAVGPTLGSWVADNVGYSQSFLVAAGIMFAAAVALILLPIREDARLFSTKRHLSWSELVDFKLLKIAFFAGLFSLSNGINSSFIILLGVEREIINISLYFTVNAVCVIAIRLMVSRLLAHRTVRQVLLSTLLLGCLSMYLIGGARSLAFILLGSIFQAAGQGVVQPFIQAECIKRVLPERRGTASSTYLMSSDVAQGIGAMIGGWIVSMWGYSSLYFGLSVLFLLCIPIVYFFLERPQMVQKA